MNKKLIFAIIGVLVLALGVGAGIFLVQRNQDIRRSAAPATTLTMVSSDPAPSVDDIFTVSVKIDTGENQAVGAELYIDFDASLLEAVDVAGGQFFVAPQEIGPSIDNNAGSLSYVLYLSPGAVPQTGTGVLATITFKALKAGSANVAFSNDSLVGGVDENAANLLVSSTPVTLNITGTTGAITDTQDTENLAGVGGLGETASPTATATPTASASATPTSSPTSTPTATPTTTASASATAPSDLPVTGVGDYTLLLLGAALVLIPFGILLAL